ncbi:hypothetical protein POL68_24295 [Stigmatella sp. ncwal1]|uniref:Uncharacterized protein n=1 Tax=Stigmatella ashevillensis TaxID=2995309 RepID=A0ABT5DD62_9BACT|nr:hypothetical protein [Stigmatella ashevillena]MDC0711612.1 hypothetical protein [Stigmatella ashevillena]
MLRARRPEGPRRTGGSTPSAREPTGARAGGRAGWVAMPAAETLLSRYVPPPLFSVETVACGGCAAKP